MITVICEQSFGAYDGWLVSVSYTHLLSSGTFVTKTKSQIRWSTLTLTLFMVLIDEIIKKYDLRTKGL